MQLKIKLFAMMRELQETDEIAVDISPGQTVGELREVIASHYPRLAPLLPAARLAASLKFVPDDYRLSQLEEVALVPPVSGG